jgi:hypothetical protein
MKKIYVVTGVLATLLLTSVTTFAQSQSREDILKEIDAKRKELLVLEQNFLAPSEEDRAKYADFLRTPDTGLIRLLPREKYDIAARPNDNTVRATPESFSRQTQQNLPQAQPTGPETTNVRTGPQNTSILTNLDDVPRVSSDTVRVKGSLQIRGGGAYYSFTRKTHEYGYGSDIQLQRGDLTTGFAGANYGLMVKLGDVSLETVGLELPEVNVLATYKPAIKLEDARIEQHRFRDGTEIDGLKVQDSLPMRPDSTYLLRALDYQQTDVLVAFRVVRVDSDGSAIILWKLLKKFSPPQLAQN